MQRFFIVAFIVSSSFSVFAQFANVKLDERTADNLACKPAVAINPKNPLNIVAASSRDNVYYTLDGGKTWMNSKITSSFGVRGESVLTVDSKGNFYYFHLSGSSTEAGANSTPDAIVCRISSDGGATWDGGSQVGSTPAKHPDNPRACVDPKGNIVLTWTEFDKYAESDTTCQSNIMISTSSNGKKWSKPMLISNRSGNCLDDDNSTGGATPATTDDKKIFVAWAHNKKLYIDRSFDNGSMWLSNDIEIGSQPGGWNLKIPGHNSNNGLPVLQIDRGKRQSSGLLYVAWADQRNGEDDTDVWFIRSNNYGDYWTSPLKIGTSEKGTHQFLPGMAVDNTSGHIYIIYYDRSAYDDSRTDVMLAYSTDFGTSFKTVKVNEEPLTPDEGAAFGDHLSVAAHKGIIIPVWTRVDNGVTSVWTAVLRHEDLTK